MVTRSGVPPTGVLGYYKGLRTSRMWDTFTGRRITNWYTPRMAQLVTRVDDRLLAEVDELVSEGVAATRSDAVRLGLEALVEHHRRQQTGQAIIDAYLRQPQGDDELGGLDEATRALVEEEPW
jgi:Arc/MetJ-type ribon-helix-helix transcriptional regulator